MKTSMTTTTSNAFISPFKQSYKIYSKGHFVFKDGPWLVLADQKVKGLRKFLKGDIHFISVKGGEQLKNLRSFEQLIQKVSQFEAKHGTMAGICVVGGGSVGDAGAFAASVYKRGVRLIQVPSTYLAVIDSAFGGKTALNFAGAKNQIGTFYPAERVLIFPKLLSKNSALISDAFAEILKMAILEGSLWKNLVKVKKADAKSFWSLAPATIEAKLKIVCKDPLEKSGERRLLNLGHTLGHLFEKLGPLRHGEAVALGLFCELEVSYLLGRLGEDDFLNLIEVWEKFFDFKKLLKKIGTHKSSNAAQILAKDKKVSGAFVNTCIVSGVGKVKIEKISLKSLIYYLQEEGILKK